MRSARPLLILALLSSASGAIGGQQVRPGLLVGRVVRFDGAPVENPVIRLTQGKKTLAAEGQADGDYRIANVSAGRWRVSVRRAGFEPLVSEIDMPAEGLRRDFTLSTAKWTLDTSLVASGFQGVRGLVSDARGAEPLAGASIKLMGTDAAASSDATGLFTFTLPPDREFVVRVERTGFETRLLTGRTPASGYRQVEVALDSATEAARDYWVWRDLERRLKFATPRAARIGREELEQTGAASLGSALDAARSAIGRGLIVTRAACLFVNGLPRPGFTVDAIRVGDVEFVEAYPSGTDLTRTLAGRWPANTPCGVDSDGIRAADVRRAAQYVVVWLRAP